MWRMLIIFLFIFSACNKDDGVRTLSKSTDRAQRPQLSYREARDRRCKIVEQCMFDSTDAFPVLYSDEKEGYEENELLTEKKLTELQKLPLSKWFIRMLPVGEAFCTMVDKTRAVCLPMRLLGKIKRRNACVIDMLASSSDFDKDNRFYYGTYCCPKLKLWRIEQIELIFKQLYSVYIKSLNYNFQKAIRSGEKGVDK